MIWIPYVSKLGEKEREREREKKQGRGKREARRGGSFSLAKRCI